MHRCRPLVVQLLSASILAKQGMRVDRIAVTAGIERGEQVAERQPDRRPLPDIQRRVAQEAVDVDLSRGTG